MRPGTETNVVKNSVICAVPIIIATGVEVSHPVAVIRVEGRPVVTLDDSQQLLHGKNNH
jgi:hypothetical protein